MHRDQLRARQFRLALVGVSAMALLTMTAGLMSMALFTDDATVENNTFDTGTIDVSVSPATALVSYDDMLPGDVANGTLTVTNGGTGALRYAMTSSSTNTDSLNLRDQLTLTVKTEGTNCATFDGTSLYSGSLASAAFGSTTSGADSGDRDLASAASETLCFRVTLPSSTGDTFQGAATTTTFTFTAEQTANN